MSTEEKEGPPQRQWLGKRECVWLHNINNDGDGRRRNKRPTIIGIQIDYRSKQSIIVRHTISNTYDYAIGTHHY